jgi:hypothetical protein
MDQENEIARGKWLLLGAGLFLVSGCISYDEIAYFVNGQDAEATITKVYESRSRWGTSLTVEYTFSEPDGTPRKGMNAAPRDWAGSLHRGRGRELAAERSRPLVGPGPVRRLARVCPRVRHPVTARRGRGTQAPQKGVNLA